MRLLYYKFSAILAQRQALDYVRVKYMYFQNSDYVDLLVTQKVLLYVFARSDIFSHLKGEIRAKTKCGHSQDVWLHAKIGDRFFTFLLF